MSNEKLKPCPFCGSADSHYLGSFDEINHLDTDEESYAVVCDFQNGGCGACGGYHLTSELAKEAWNTRTDSEIDSLKREIEKMKCCGNCKHDHWMYDTPPEECDGCYVNDFMANLKNWIRKTK